MFRLLIYELKQLARKRTLVYCMLKICCDVVYAKYLTDIYAYSGSIADINMLKNITSWYILMLMLMLYYKIVDCDLKICFSLLMTLSVIPTLSVFWISNKPWGAFMEIVIYWIIFEMCILYFSTKEKKMISLGMNNGRNTLSGNGIIGIIWLLTALLTVYFSYRYGKFRLFIRFEDVYIYRLDSSNSMGMIEGYLFSWMSMLFIPWCFSIHLTNKRWILSFLDILMGLMSYGIYGLKGIVFLLVMVTGLWVLKHYNSIQKPEAMITCACVCGLLIAPLLKPISGLLLGLTQRLFFLPAEAHFYYFDFFQTHPFLFLRQSILRHFFSNPLSGTAAILIGSDPKYFLTGGYQNLNNGLFSDAYQNFGFIGVLIYPFIVTGLLNILCKSVKRYDPVIKYTIIIEQIIYLFSGYLFTWLLTGGLLLVIIISYFLNHYNITILSCKEKKIKIRKVLNGHLGK